MGRGCPQCQHGDQFDIIGPNETAQSQSWGDSEEVEYICELMNDAYAAGRASFAQQILNMTEGEEKTDAEKEPETVEAPKVSDEDIPF